MEKQNIQGYLQYFPNKDVIKRSPKRSHPKLLPHIIEEYQYRITNHLLIKKIISPKRDKLIISSLQNIRRSNQSPSHKLKIHAKGSLIDTIRRSTQYRNQSEHRAKTADFKQHKAELSLSSADFNTPYPQKMKIFENSLQKDSLQQKQQKMEIKSSTFYRSLHQKRTKPKTIIPQIYGLGPTILSIFHIQLIANPLLKPETLVQLQLIQKYGLSNSYYHTLDAQKVVRTQPITVSNLPRDDYPNSKVKFALKVSKIGDFVPLRLWKYSGVECIELGTVDIPLSLYRLGLSEETAVTQSDKLEWQYKLGTTDCRRLVFNGQLSCQLRGINCQQNQTKVKLKYKVYSKRFTKLSTQQSSLSQV